MITTTEFRTIITTPIGTLWTGWEATDNIHDEHTAMSHRVARSKPMSFILEDGSMAFLGEQTVKNSIFRIESRLA